MIPLKPPKPRPLRLDLVNDGERVMILKGGRGGKGL